uniref:Uncharacterized protein n=1 Tax=Mimivirus LCMiAC01 TaxID=2506608 RepID=A0A481YYQ3_9VIRU|nr:MAG: hypothetical protein LCMiAC01_00470 [Mimivirus LCMiAC01]
MCYKNKYIKYKNKYTKLKLMRMKIRNMKRTSNYDNMDKEILGEFKKQLLTMKKCYKKLNKMDDYDRLLKSVYPFQASDYFLLKLPKSVKIYDDASFRKSVNLPKLDAHKDNYVPCDASLKNIVLYFWSKNFITLGWDEPYKLNTGFISFEFKTSDDKNTSNELLKLFGSDNIIKLKLPSFYGLEKEAPEYYKKQNKQIDDIMTENPTKILMITYTSDISISYAGNIRINFNKMQLKWLHKKLDIKEPDVTKALPGYISCYNIIKK